MGSHHKLSRCRSFVHHLWSSAFLTMGADQFKGGGSTANGYKNAGEWRDKRAALMTATDIATARAMLRECMNSGYKNCGD